jgi:hypothetical protein
MDFIKVEGKDLPPPPLYSKSKPLVVGRGGIYLITHSTITHGCKEANFVCVYLSFSKRFDLKVSTKEQS